MALTLQEEETRLRNELDEAREQFETAQSNLLEQQNKRAVEEDEVQLPLRCFKNEP